MAYVLDIAVILILGLAIFFGAKKGFIESTIGLISMVLAVVAACLLNGPLANFAYTSFVQPNVETAIETRISEAVEATGVTEPSAYLAAAEEELPGFVRLESIPIRFTFTVEGEQIRNLFSMTPHVFRIGKEGARRLQETTVLTDTASCVLNVYRRA